ncbi:hypothetical protein ACFTWH_16880 [Streptomyces sp. NPDC057011]|uniref:hypothetical protein n=1 Tax=unclassified Streptomyces TaxID=2593676 RepID=UPI003643EAB4
MRLEPQWEKHTQPPHHKASTSFKTKQHRRPRGANLRFAALMAGGSIAGALLGGPLLGVIPDLVVIPALAVILLVSAVKVARHT